MNRITNSDFIINETLKGNAFQFASGPLTATSVAPLVFLIRTGLQELIIADVKITASGDNITATGYKGPTVSNDGTPFTNIENKNFLSSKIIEAKFFSAPTVIDNGVQIDTASGYGSNQLPQRNVILADATKGDMYLLQPETDYLFEVTSTGTSPLFFRMLLCESNYVED